MAGVKNFYIGSYSREDEMLQAVYDCVHVLNDIGCKYVKVETMYYDGVLKSAHVLFQPIKQALRVSENVDS